MYNQDLLNRKYTKILNRYNELYFGKFMRDEAIFPILMEEFDLAETTIYRIILKMSKSASVSITESQASN